MSGERAKPFGSDADYCRERGWGVGTYLVGDEGYGPTVIKITALGERNIMAIAVAGPGSANPHEANWVLYCRDWREIDGTAAEASAERDAAQREAKRLRAYLADFVRIVRDEPTNVQRACTRIDEILAADAGAVSS